MRDTLKVECLIQALDGYVSAKQEHDKARDNFQGYSWGYHGYHYIEKMESAAEDFQKRLDDYIESKVQEILTKHQE